MSVRGWVYVLTNKAMPGLVKVGYSTKDPSLRALELEGTGLPHAFEVAYDVLVIEPRDVEQQVHQDLKVHHAAKEFFRIDLDKAIQSIRAVISSQGKTILHEARLEHSAAEPRNSFNSAAEWPFQGQEKFQKVETFRSEPVCSKFGCYAKALPGNKFCKTHGK